MDYHNPYGRAEIPFSFSHQSMNGSGIKHPHPLSGGAGEIVYSAKLRLRIPIRNRHRPIL